ncbi:hypothetical protein GCM10017562_43240 [Streptomyces roseofulvus]
MSGAHEVWGIREPEVTRAGTYVVRVGLGTSSPPQLGQTPDISSVQGTQKVHSYEQIRAGPSAGRAAVSQRSQRSRISRAMRP